jgi:hypothetical protein
MNSDLLEKGSIIVRWSNHAVKFRINNLISPEKTGVQTDMKFA